MGIRTQYTLIKNAEESLLSTESSICPGNLKGQVNRDQTL